MLLLLPVAVAQGQTPTVVLPALSPPAFIEPLRQRFFPPLTPLTAKDSHSHPSSLWVSAMMIIFFLRRH